MILLFHSLINFWSGIIILLACLFWIINLLSHTIYYVFTEKKSKHRENILLTAIIFIFLATIFGAYLAFRGL